jgi:exosortase C (VPDSG-CTERM-specific)
MEMRPESIVPPAPRRMAGLGVAVGVLLACFHRPLLELARLSLGNELYSYIPLIPLISLYLVWLKRAPGRPDSAPAARLAVFPLALGLALLGVYWFDRQAGGRFEESDYLALMILAFLSLLAAACFALVGARTLRAMAFPLAFLIFAVPLPVQVEQMITAFLQQGSATVTNVFFLAAFMPMWRQGLTFNLPGISLNIAPECSGIHSTLVLFITSFLAGYLFLRSPWRRAILVCAVLPLALLRNGFRVFVIGELCVHIGPEMINSYIHRHGGPIFFVLSLIPFLYLLRCLSRSERSVPGPSALSPSASSPAPISAP